MSTELRRWKIGEFEFDGQSHCLRRGKRRHYLGPHDAQLLVLLIENYESPLNDTHDLVRQIWGTPGIRSSLYKAIQHLRDAFGGKREAFIGKNPFRLVVKPQLLDSRKIHPDHARTKKQPHQYAGAESGQQQGPESDPQGLTAVERLAAAELYDYTGGHVSAIRLFGAADEFIAPEDILVHYQHARYHLPPDIRPYAQRRIRELKRQAEREDKVFFDGPCVRLLHWQASPPEKGPGATLERNIVKLFLGPVGWFQYEGTNGFVREELHPDAPGPYEYWVGLSKLINDFDVRHSKLSNIFGNAITIFTQDGKVGYQERRNRQSAVPGQLSSAVAENTNRYFDETAPNNPLELMNSFPYEMKLSDGPDNKSCKPFKGVPHPVAAVRRGLNEETSWRMTEFVPQRGIKFIGMAFGLDSLHPDALWIVCVNLTADAFDHECRTHRGKDWHEARLRFVPASFDANETQRVLRASGWVPGGKAALVRAIELIETIAAKRRISVAKVFDLLAHT